MPTPAGRAALPVLILGGVLAAGLGAIAIVERLAAARRDRSPARPGTPRLAARLPIALWPSDGTEPIVEHDPRGWRLMVAALHHRDTFVDDACRARAVVIAMLPRREQDARRQIALEAHVLRGTYEPDLIAAAWLHPLTVGMDAPELASFGIGATAIDAVRASARLDAEPELEGVWRREFGMNVVRPDVTDALIAETGSDRRGMLWALLRGWAADRVVLRQAG